MKEDSLTAQKSISPIKISLCSNMMSNRNIFKLISSHTSTNKRFSYTFRSLLLVLRHNTPNGMVFYFEIIEYKGTKSKKPSKCFWWAFFHFSSILKKHFATSRFNGIQSFNNAEAKAFENEPAQSNNHNNKMFDLRRLNSHAKYSGEHLL